MKPVVPPMYVRGDDFADGGLAKWKEKRDPQWALDIIGHLTAPDVPTGVAEAIWYLCGYGYLGNQDRHDYHRIKRLGMRLYGLSDAKIVHLLEIHFRLEKTRCVLSPRRAENIYPPAHAWRDAYRRGVVARAWRWHARGWIPNRGKPPLVYSIDNAAERMSLPFKTLAQWIKLVKIGKLDGQPPQLLSSRARHEIREIRKAEILSADKAPLGTVDLNSEDLEARSKGVATTAADVCLIPRKRTLAKETDFGARIEGGQLVVLAAYKPHPGQVAFHNSGARFRFIVAGRRGGKTCSGSREAIRHAAMIPGSTGWIAAPTYPMLDKVVIPEVLRHVAEAPGLVAPGGWVKKDRKLTFSNGSVVYFVSCEWEDTLRGGGLDWVWIDEGQMIKKAAYDILRAATSDTLGRIWVTGTPLGRNWLYKEWSKGADEKEHDFASFRFASTMNPIVPAEELEAARRSLPAAFFRQEYLAEFVEGVASVFGDLSPCLVSQIDAPQDEQIVIGADFGKRQDATAFVGMNQFGQVRFVERRDKEQYAVIIQRLVELSAEYGNAPVVADAAGPGDSVVEQLVNEGVNVYAMNFNSYVVKNNSIMQLILDIEGGRIWIPQDEERLLYELQIYRKELTPSGSIRYSAPDGEHDDCVIALGCANWGVNKLHLAGGICDGAAWDGSNSASAPEDLKRLLWAANRGTGWGDGQGHQPRIRRSGFKRWSDRIAGQDAPAGVAERTGCHPAEDKRRHLRLLA